jgi:adenine deaminase
MSIAVNYLRDAGGGQVVVGDGQVKGSVELPIAGLMSDLRPKEVASDLKSLKRAIDRLGCSLKQPLMILSSLALAVIPEVRITDKGLVDVNKQKIIH